MNDISSSDKGLSGYSSFTFWHKLHRFIWGIVWLLFASWTPPQLRSWRCFLLRAFGAEIGGDCDVRGSARVWYPRNLRMSNRTIIAERVNCYNMAMVALEYGTIVSQDVTICAGTHNIENKKLPLEVYPITIGKFCWVAASAFIGPGVQVGDGCVIGARAVIFKSTEPMGVYVGNPARLIKYRSVVHEF
jgi:putative colanic acid biosynthesis acetyltransferase WcaF